MADPCLEERSYRACDSIPRCTVGRGNDTRHLPPGRLDDGIARYLGMSRASTRQIQSSSAHSYQPTPSYDWSSLLARVFSRAAVRGDTGTDIGRRSTPKYDERSPVEW